MAEAKNLASTAQTTADSAVKNASSVASDLTAVASQAKANSSGITKVTSNVGLLQTTVADNSGNISKIQETASQIQQAVSDNSGNIMVAKQTADSAVAVASDAKSNVTVAVQTASQASITASNASGQAASAVLTANGAMTTASDAKSDATVAIQTASGASLTATNAKSDATVAKQTASAATVQASNAESDFAQLSIRANKIEANVATNSGAIASVQQTANGLTTTVADKADQSTVTQLSNAIQSKVDSSTYTSAINQLSNDINLRVKSADLISQINLQAGTALIQSNKLVLDSGTTVFTGSAFIPDAAISEINTDKLYFSDANGNKSFMSTNLGALDPMAPANTLSIRYNTGYEVTTSDRGVFFMMGQNYTRYAVRSKYSDKFSGVWASNTEAFFIEEGQGLHLWAVGEDQSAWALYNSNNVGIRASLATTNAIDVGKVDDGYAYNTKMDTSPTAMTFYINGWEWVAGYVEAMGHSQHSVLSAKTRIEQADADHMLDLINQTELTTFDYKSELADGTDHRHIGPIIDDVNDVAQYQIPSEFVTPTKTARDDGNIVGALIGAVQALTKRIKTLEEKV